ncbi:hypothetical protein IFM89_031509 [Coptis chinensis]|uniref:Uncharacterized protein n=1 Tax=Coptis chinensis TaxID=261450 RepID=A0A835LTE8_9MAGN|nr:hypothetical protein IFM89_031509 [Coptis chinensis]
MRLPDPILNKLKADGISRPTPIQFGRKGHDWDFIHGFHQGPGFCPCRKRFPCLSNPAKALLVPGETITAVLIFCENRADVDRVHPYLLPEGHNMEA